ncbi:MULTISPECIES: TonB-dependent siderophore receptor [unclassified Pseudomonas]|uniref:TonB-dependent siderophore receptor n=1 Tax=unclassified Pseudomonas TaxID=196821 RepID=UPI001F967001|nr:MULTISPECIES: TonB-dependent siderophore receptor [unclassified Pseudomonas]MCF5233272.1 TonB-dependent siderophore receptor [Pseudomonas sp. PA-5-4H]MCF5239025.1 TonB-dependent siderophore receptor [Pseudomonas sp. PA-5-4G]MCF5250157.1 TonB-dependent siderophore receptor [Pseudomonas sp. PA-5-4B]MCF5252282.1 TonB-dependent siderophore receptor [Pseudomonas sp. PA-5-4B]MCF5263394.1 TonB-dependent siderophore receptor [Pseudomonas sp. PA-5-4A]
MRRLLNTPLLPSAIALALALPVAGYVQAQEVELNVPAQPLGSALQEFGRQTNLQVLYSPTDVEGKRSHTIKGKLQPGQAMTTLLSGTGISYDLQGSSFTISAAKTSALELGATQVTANQLGTITEGSGSYTPGTIATATRLVLSPRETPQSISVVTRQAMDDFSLKSIDDVMRHTPGITVATYDSERTSYFSRGFAIQNFQYDGIPILQDAQYSSGHTLTDTVIYDRVEILKGATGLLTGAGGPGGTINMVRKKPTSEFKGYVDLGAGSWDNYRSEIDVSGPLTETGNVRGRAVAAYQDKHTFLDHYQRQTNVYYGILEFDLAPDTLLTIGGDYQDSDPQGSSWSGAASLFDSAGNHISTPRSFNNGAKYSKWKQYTRTAFATLEHTFDNGWVGKAQYNHQINGYKAPLSALLSPNAETGKASLLTRTYNGETTSDTGDLYATGPFSLFGREHELVVGTSVSRSHWLGSDYTNATNYDNSHDYFNWDGDAPKPDRGPRTKKNDELTRQSASYITGRFSLADDLHLILGTRVNNYEVSGTSQVKDTGKVVPYAGITYDLNDNFSAYASFTEIYLPQDDYRDRNDKPLEPDEGKNYEIGLKGEFFDGRLNSSLAYFEVHEKNRAVDDTDYIPNSHPGLDYASRGTEAKTKGYEAEISGELAPGWQLQAGYTHKIMRDKQGEKLSTWEPEDQVNIYTSYKLTGPLDKLTLGTGVRWQGTGWKLLNNYAKGTEENFSQDPLWIVDAMARYQVTENVSATLNVNNIFDKKYYTNIGFYNSAYYGDPRNVMLSTRWNF